MLAADSGMASGGEEEEDVSEYEQNRVETNSHYSSESEDEPDSEHNPLLEEPPSHPMVFMKYAKIETPYSKGFKAPKTDFIQYSRCWE